MRVIRSIIGTSDILRAIQENYLGNYPDGLCQFEYHGVNDVYKYINGDQTRFFKLYARMDIGKDAILDEVKIVNNLRQLGLPVADAIEKTDGSYLVSVEAPEGMRYGVLYSEAAGHPCDNYNLDVDETIKIGRLLSVMHKNLDNLDEPVSRWRLDESLFIDRSMAVLEVHSQYHNIDIPFLREVAEEVKRQIEAKANTWMWGLCHGDVWGGNIHKDRDGRLMIYDFDFCGYGWRAYDVSMILGAIGWGAGDDAEDKRRRLLESFLKGYESRAHLSDSEIEAVYKVFVPFRRIFNMGYLYDSLLYVWGNRYRNVNIDNDLKLLKEYVRYYWG